MEPGALEATRKLRETRERAEAEERERITAERAEEKRLARAEVEAFEAEVAKFEAAKPRLVEQFGEIVAETVLQASAVQLQQKAEQIRQLKERHALPDEPVAETTNPEGN
jgi:hypothetical protein